MRGKIDTKSGWLRVVETRPVSYGWSNRYQTAFKPLTTAVGNWKGEIFAWWEHPITNAYTEAIAGLVKLTNHTGRGYSFKAIRAKLLYSNLPTFHRPIFDRSLEERPPFITLGEIKNYGVKFSTLYENLGEV
jgi:hypothetical protein